MGQRRRTQHQAYDDLWSGVLRAAVALAIAGVLVFAAFHFLPAGS